jgi:protein SCO1/2
MAILLPTNSLKASGSCSTLVRVSLERYRSAKQHPPHRHSVNQSGFARCPDICPSEMLKVGKVMDTLAKDYPELAKKVQPVFVSVDPARDSIKALREYGKDFHPSYIFLTGSPEQVQQMAKKYRVYVSKADETEDGDYLVDHSIVIYFHDDTGDLADCFTQSMRPSDVVEKVVERMTTVQTV